jgi:hypothetical protein
MPASRPRMRGRCSASPCAFRPTSVTSAAAGSATARLGCRGHTGGRRGTRPRRQPSRKSRPSSKSSRTSPSRPGGTRPRRLSCCAATSGSNGRPWANGWRKTSRSTPIHGIRTTGGYPGQLPAGPRGAGRRDDRGVGLSAHPVRDRPAAALLPAARRGPDGAAAAVRNSDSVPVQGHRLLLVGGHSQNGTARGRAVPDGSACLGHAQMAGPVDP